MHRYFMSRFLFLLAVVAVISSYFFKNESGHLIVSILIRLISASFAIYLGHKYRTKQLLVLAVMFFAMSIRQVITLLVWNNVVKETSFVHFYGELPAILVTLMTLGTIVYIGRLMENYELKIKDKDDFIQNIGKLLPICSYCKSIRTGGDFRDQESWVKIENYLSANETDSDVTHGICPGCMEKNFPHIKFPK